MLSDRVDDVEAALLGAGALSVTVSRSRAGADVLEPAPGEAPLWSDCRLEALFDADADIGELRGTLDSVAVPAAAIHTDVLEDEDWVNAWRRHAVRERFGGCLWVVPRGERVPDGASLELDPGLAFGSGSHPTTRLCLDWIARSRMQGCRVLDFGCGSGILGLAALQLGAERLVAVDHDPQALLATQENAAYNAIDPDRVSLGDADLLVEGAEFDVVLANVLANPLIELAALLTSQLAPGGRLVLSGILEAQADEVRSAYPELTFEPPALEADDAGNRWVRLVGTRTNR